MNEDVQKNYLDLLDERFHEAGSVLVRQYWSLTIGEVFPTGSQFAGVTMRELVDLVVKEIAELNRIGLAIIPGIMGVLKNEQYKRLLERGAPPVQKVVAVLITESKGVVTTLESNPTLLQLKIDAMRNLTDDNFRGDSPRARAAADWRDIWPLLGRAAPLETFPQRIAELEKEIAELVVIWAGRERSGAGHRLPVTSIIEFNRPEPLKIRTDFETR